MLSTIKRWLGVTALQSRIVELETENAALRNGTAVVTPDGKVAKVELPPPKFIRPRAHSFHQLARQREAQAWRDMCQEAYPNANVTAKR